MAELAIIVVAALVAPALVALAIRIGRVAVVRRERRKLSVPSLPLGRWAARLESANHPAGINEDRAETDDVRFCQACGHATSGLAKYCRACGAFLDEI